MRFIQRTDAMVRMLMRFPNMSRKGRKGTREVLIAKHNILCFRVKGAADRGLLGYPAASAEANDHPSLNALTGST
jgi:hypothetical protein